MAKLTQADINDMKNAVKTLTSLQHEMGRSDSAASYLKAVTDTGSCFGSLEGNGPKIASFIAARHTAVSTNITTKGGPAVTSAIGMLQATITNYENNEKAHKAAADGTPAGQSGQPGSGSQYGGAK